MRALLFYFITLVSLFPCVSHAGGREEARILACLQSAADAFQVDVLPLVILRQQEAGWIGAEVSNKNGSVDLGPMQVNSSWLPRLAKFGITKVSLRDDPCVNAYVSAWIFKQAWQSTGDVAMAMATYHSSTPKHQHSYLLGLRKVIANNLANLTKTDDARSSTKTPAAGSSVELAGVAP